MLSSRNLNLTIEQTENFLIFLPTQSSSQISFLLLSQVWFELRRIHACCSTIRGTLTNRISFNCSSHANVWSIVVNSSLFRPLRNFSIYILRHEKIKEYFRFSSKTHYLLTYTRKFYTLLTTDTRGKKTKHAKNFDYAIIGVIIIFYVIHISI